MHTSRAALNRLLDEKDASLTLTKLASAASALVNEPVARRCATVVSHDTSHHPTSVSTLPRRRGRFTESDPSNSFVLMPQCRFNRHLRMRPVTGRCHL